MGLDVFFFFFVVVIGFFLSLFMFSPQCVAYVFNCEEVVNQHRPFFHYYYLNAALSDIPILIYLFIGTMLASLIWG